MEQALTDTYFAPAERAPRETILGDFEYIRSLPYLTPALEGMSQIVLIMNKQRQIVFANNVFYNSFDIDSMDAVLGLRPGESMNCNHSDQTPGGCGTTKNCRMCGAVLAILNSLEGKSDNRECRIIRKEDNQALDLQVKAVPICLDNRQFSIVSVLDISHEKRRRTLERVFFHDIMNVLAGIKGISELLADLISKRLKKKKSLADSICHGMSDLVEIIRAQKDLADAEKNELIVKPTQINSLNILQEIEGLYKSHPITKNTRIEICLSSQNVDFESDVTLLKRCIGNLTKNAIEASGDDDVVTIGCDMENDRLKFWVYNPTVIPEQIQQQIFQRSFSTKGTGRGLGTYSIKLLTENYLNGSISFTSNNEECTVFKMSLPLSL